MVMVAGFLGLMGLKEMELRSGFGFGFRVRVWDNGRDLDDWKERRAEASMVGKWRRERKERLLIGQKTREVFCFCEGLS